MTERHIAYGTPKNCKVITSVKANTTFFEDLQNKNDQEAPNSIPIFFKEENINSDEATLSENKEQSVESTADDNETDAQIENSLQVSSRL